MIDQLIQVLLPCLPRYAEEEGDFFSVPRIELIQHLIAAGYSQDIAENSLGMLENLLDTLATLNPVALQKGEWSFVSFPAQLMATSVLTALSDSDSRLFATNFWNTQGIPNAKKDQQRDVLKKLENARFENHASREAQPIRYCYVAWSIIKLDGKILFYQREDTQKRFDKSAGDYGLIGGRANQNDIPLTDTEAVLNALQSPQSELIKKSLPETLKRELHEEAGLLFEEHYTFKPWRILKPYQQVQGSAPNHALTEYYLDIFQIDLTLEGYIYLQQKVEHDERLVWFSIEDMVRGEAADGKIPYIKALYDDFADNRETLETELMKVPDSFGCQYRFQQKKYGITFPVDYQKSILAGTLGKEKRLDLSLTARQLQILLGLAAHLRGFDFSVPDKTIVLHPFGWIEIRCNSVLASELIALAELVKSTDLVIENHYDLFFRLSIRPEIISFDASLFSFIVKQDDLDAVKTKIPALIQRKSFDTTLGVVKEKTEEFKLTLDLVCKLKSLSGKDFSSDNEIAVNIEDAYKKGLHKDPVFVALGLRSLVRREAGLIKFEIDFTVVD